MALLFVSGTWSVDVTKSDFPLNLVYSVRCFDVALSRWLSRHFSGMGVVVA